MEVQDYETARYFRTVFDSVPDVLIIVDRGGKIVLANPQIEAVFGYRPEELVGQEIEILVADAIKAKHRALTQHYVEGPTLRPMGRNRELTGRHKDGTLVPVEISLSPNRHGDDFFIVAAVRDVSERVRAQRRIAESEKNFKTFFELCPAGAAFLSPERKVIRANQAFRHLFFVEPDCEVTGQLLSRFATLRDWPAFEDALHSLETHGEPVRGDFPLVPEGVCSRWIRIEFSLVRNFDSLSSVVFCLFSDISVQKEIELKLLKETQELAESNKKLGVFTTFASHDLRAPARRASLFLQMIEKECGRTLDKRARSYLSVAVNESNKMQALVEDLLNYSQVCGTAPALKPISLIKVVGDTLEILKPDIEAKGARVTYGFLPTVTGNELQLRRLFSNLIENAIKFSPHKPRVHVDSSTEKGFFEVTVSDNGVGVPKGDCEKIFEVFYRGHSESEFAGSGIGLASCKRIMENHGGKISVVSSLGEGAVFSLRFPINADRADAVPDPELPLPPRPFPSPAEPLQTER